MEDYYFRQDPISDNEEDITYDPEIEMNNMEEKLKKLWDNVLKPYVTSYNSKEILHSVHGNDFHFLWSFFLDNNNGSKRLLSEIRKNNS